MTEQWMITILWVTATAGVLVMKRLKMPVAIYASYAYGICIAVTILSAIRLSRG